MTIIMAYEKDINKKQDKQEKPVQNPFGSAPKNGMPGGGFNFYWIYLIIGAVLFGVYFFSGNEMSREVGYTDFERMAQEGDFSTLVVNTKTNSVVAKLTKAPELENMKGLKTAFEQAKQEGKQISIETSIPSADKFADNVDKWRNAEDSKFSADVRYEKSSGPWDIVLSLASPLLMLFFLWFIFFRGMGARGGAGGGGIGGIFSVGRSKAQVYEKDNKMKVMANTQYNSTIEKLTKLKYESELRLNALKAWTKVTDTNGMQTTLMVTPFNELANKMTTYIQTMYGRTDVSAHFNVSTKANSFSFGLNRNGVYIPYDMLSSGEKCLYVIALMICITYNSKSPLKLIMIDDALDHLDDIAADSTFNAIKLINDVQFIMAGVKDCPNSSSMKISV